MAYHWTLPRVKDVCKTDINNEEKKSVGNDLSGYNMFIKIKSSKRSMRATLFVLIFSGMIASLSASAFWENWLKNIVTPAQTSEGKKDETCK